MNKYIIILAVIFGLCGTSYYYKLDRDRLQDICSLQQENIDIILSRLKKNYEDKLKTESKIKELEELAKNDKTFDWYQDISSSDVIKQLQAD